MKRFLLLLLIFIGLFAYAEPSVRAILDFSYENDFCNLKDTPFNENNVADISTFNQEFYGDIFLESSVTDNFYLSAMMDTRLKYLLSQWNVEYTNDTGLFSVGFYNNEIDYNPAKVLESADYFGWLYKTRRDEKNITNVKLQFFFDNSAIKLIYVPSYDWVYNTNLGDFLRKDIESVYYLQYQFFYDFVDAGAYFSMEANDIKYAAYNAGLWATLSLDWDLNIYDEFSWTSRKWMPYMSADDYNVTFKNIHGIRNTIGISKSFYNIPYTLYAEFKYNSDGYYSKEWDDISDSFAIYDLYYGMYSPKIKAQLLREIDYLDVDKFSLALHLRQDSYFFDKFGFDSTLIYFLPESFLLKEDFKLNLIKGLSVSYNIYVPFSFAGQLDYYSLYPYHIKNEVRIKYTLYLEN